MRCDAIQSHATNQNLWDTQFSLLWHRVLYWTAPNAFDVIFCTFTCHTWTCTSTQTHNITQQCIQIYIYTHISPHVQMCGSKRQNLSKPFKKSLLSVETHLPHVFPSANEAVAFLLRRRAANYDWGSVSIIVMGVYPTINFNWGWFIIGFTTTHDIYIYINRGVCHDIRYMIIYHGVRHDTVYDICSGFFLCVYIYMYSVVAVGNLEWPNKSVRLNNNFPAAVWIFE